jgi:hypothetical protein
MNNTVFGIASFNRPDKQYFLAYLKGLGYKREDIYIGTQCSRDYEQYQELFGWDATVIYRQGENVCHNKNHLLDVLSKTGKRIIIASDKVRGLQYLSGGKAVTIDSRKTFDATVDFGYALAAKNRCQAWGVYPTNNAYFMKRSASVDKMLLGCFMAFQPRTTLRFDPQFPIKEDFEISCRIVKQGGHTLRFNNLCLDATFHQKGGSWELWHAEGDAVNKMCCERMLRKFPSLVVGHPTRKNELRFTGKSRTIAL